MRARLFAREWPASSRRAGRRSAAFAVLLGLAGCRTSPPEPAWIDLFDGTALGSFVSTPFGGEGPIDVRDGAIWLEAGNPLTGVTWQGEPPHGDYELEVVAAPVSGSDFFLGLTFPVGQEHLTLVLGGWGGAVCGLSCIDGLDAARNATRTLRSFAPRVDCTVRVRVDAAAVAVWLDGAPFAAVPRPGRTFSLRSEVLLSAPFGLCSYATSSRVRAVRWRRLA